MKTFILILVLEFPQGFAVINLDYFSREACERSGAAVIEKNKELFSKIAYTCAGKT